MHLFHREPQRPPIEIVAGEGAYLHARDGRRILDAAAGAAVASLGHGRADLAEVLARQAGAVAFAHPSKFTTAPAEALAEQLAARAPAGLERVLFTSGGSEAVEGAVKLARQLQLARGKPAKRKVVSRRTSYHGATLGALALTRQNARREPFEPLLAAQPAVAPAACERCPFGREPSSCDLECADDLESVLRAEGPETVAAFVAEPISGSSAPGRHPPDAYWQRIREICDRFDVAFIADEVMSGNGRSGRWWALQHAGVAPDLIVTAKGISAGYAPLGAVLAREEHYQALRRDGGFRHGHTFAANPVACAVGQRVIEVIERDGLLPHVQHVGALLKRRLREALGGHPHVGAIRGRGLLLGVEFVADRATLAPLPAEARFATRFALTCLEEGVYVYQGGGHVDGRRGDHALLAPPFVLNEEQVEELVQGMARALARVTAEGASPPR